jgi:hypothetical protein
MGRRSVFSSVSSYLPWFMAHGVINRHLMRPTREWSGMASTRFPEGMMTRRGGRVDLGKQFTFSFHLPYK